MKFLLYLIFSLSSSLHASPFGHYFDEAGAYYNIPPLLLKNIATIESANNPNAIRINDNGTRDYGLMQINSIHFKTLQQWGINEHNIMDPKVNIFVGSWLVSQHIKERGFNLQAIGNYHSKTQVHKEKWLRRLSASLKRTPSS